MNQNHRDKPAWIREWRDTRWGMAAGVWMHSFGQKNAQTADVDGSHAAPASPRPENSVR